MGEAKRAQMTAQQSIPAVILVPPFCFVVPGTVNLHIQYRDWRDHQEVKRSAQTRLPIWNARIHLKAEQQPLRLEGLTQTHMAFGVQVDALENLFPHGP